LLPPGFTGRYFLYVQADAEDDIFEDAVEANNAARMDDFFDVMPIPYADLVVASAAVTGPAFSGQPLEVRWRVENRGIGLTNQSNWSDRIYLAADPAGNNIVAHLATFTHLGQLGVGDGYDRTATVTLPQGISGQHYLVVKTGGPFEFIHTDNNTGVSDPFDVQLSSPPDLTVTDIVVPPETILEGTAIDIRWTVENTGTGDAEGFWFDTVYLRKVGDPTAPTIALGTYRYDGPLEAGKGYTRWEQVRLPDRTHGLYEAVVTTNYNRQLYEHNAYDNNTSIDDATLSVSLKPRPDIVVSEIVAPEVADPGQTIAVEFTVLNQGNTATTSPHWSDAIYLSLDPVITSDDIQIGLLGNQSALDVGESYRSMTDSAVIPERFRGTVY
ncbi:MAG: hypothetical protein D6741_04555, partial [Planctomycetota bacterium]